MRGRALPLPALPLPRDGPLARGGRRRATTRASGFSEAPGFAAGIARPYRPYLVGEERPARLRAAAAGRDGHHPPLPPGPRRRRGARERALARARPRARVRGPGGPALAQHLPGRRPRPRLRRALGATCSTSWPRAARALGPGRRGGGARRGRRGCDGRRVRAPDQVHRPRDVRIFHKEARAAAGAGAPRPGWGRRRRRSARARAPGRRVAAGARGAGARRRPLPRPRPRAAARRPVAGARAAAARWSTTCTSTSGRPPAPSAGSRARCAAPLALGGGARRAVRPPGGWTAS